MKAIYKKEVKSYLTSMIGYVFIFFILLLEGIYFTAYNLQNAYPLFGNTLSAITVMFLILVPILTMKTIAEERKQKTDQLLLTAPVSVGEIVTGKLYPLIMGKYGTVSYAMAYTAVLGFALLGFAQIAVGIFWSSVTENPVIAAVVTFIVLFICYMITGIGSLIPDSSMASLTCYMILVLLAAVWIYHMIQNLWIAAVIGIAGEAALAITYMVKSTLFEGSIQKFLDVFNITSHFDNFTNGILDLQGVVYFLSVIIIFLVLTVQTITKRRWN